MSLKDDVTAVIKSNASKSIYQNSLEGINQKADTIASVLAEYIRRIIISEASSRTKSFSYNGAITARMHEIMDFNAHQISTNCNLVAIKWNPDYTPEFRYELTDIAKQLYSSLNSRLFEDGVVIKDFYLVEDRSDGYDNQLCCEIENMVFSNYPKWLDVSEKFIFPVEIHFEKRWFSSQRGDCIVKDGYRCLRKNHGRPEFQLVIPFEFKL